MKVNFFAGLRQIVGQKMVEVQIPEAATVSQLVEQVIHSYPALEAEMLDEQQNLYQHVHIVINGRNINFLEGGMDRVIEPEDVVSIFPAIGGGCI